MSIIQLTGTNDTWTSGVGANEPVTLWSDNNIDFDTGTISVPVSAYGLGLVLGTKLVADVEVDFDAALTLASGLFQAELTGNYADATFAINIPEQTFYFDAATSELVVDTSSWDVQEQQIQIIRDNH